MGKPTKPKRLTSKDLQEAIAAETMYLIREEQDKILHRAKKRLAEKFGR
jgi:hypothetical protein